MLLLPQIAEMTFGQNVLTPANRRGDPSKRCDLPPQSDPETDVYNFGIMLLEIISGKLPYSEEQGHLVDWVSLKSVPLLPLAQQILACYWSINNLFVCV